MPADRPEFTRLSEADLERVRDDGFLFIDGETYVATDDDVDAASDEIERRYQDRESRRNARDHAAWKGAHNRRLHAGGC